MQEEGPANDTGKDGCQPEGKSRTGQADDGHPAAAIPQQAPVDRDRAPVPEGKPDQQDAHQRCQQTPNGIQVAKGIPSQPPRLPGGPVTHPARRVSVGLFVQDHRDPQDHHGAHQFRSVHEPVCSGSETTPNASGYRLRAYSFSSPGSLMSWFS